MKFEYIKESQMTVTQRDSIENSIRTIASTPYGTAPFARSLGIKNYPPQSNSDVIRNHYATEVIMQVKKWEDRATVSEVRFEKDNEVRMVIKNG